MTDEVRSIGALRLDDRRTDERRAGDRRSAQRRTAPAAETPEAAAPAADMADAAETPARPAPTPPSDASPAAFAAQMLGQSGQKRGLRGGPPVLDAARHTYLGAEYSGPAERRPLPGKATDTDV